MTLHVEHHARLDRFVDLLRLWNRTINLVSEASAPEIWDRHVHDSLQCVPLIPPNANRGIDLGSGAGFPGLVLAIATDLPFDLIEADQRKAAFLREAARITQTAVTVHACRIDAAPVAPAPLVTARALAPLPQLLALAAPLLQPEGVCLFPKGARVDGELTAAKRKWHMQIDAVPSRTAPGAVVLRISELARVT